MLHIYKYNCFLYQGFSQINTKSKIYYIWKCKRCICSKECPFNSFTFFRASCFKYSNVQNFLGITKPRKMKGLGTTEVQAVWMPFYCRFTSRGSRRGFGCHSLCKYNMEIYEIQTPYYFFLTLIFTRITKVSSVNLLLYWCWFCKFPFITFLKPKIKKWRGKIYKLCMRMWTSL